MILLIYEVFILFVFVVVLELDINSARTGQGDGIYTGKKRYAPPHDSNRGLSAMYSVRPVHNVHNQYLIHP